MRHKLPEQAGRESDSVRPFMESLFRHKWLWLSIFIVVAGLTVCYVFLAPRKYQSEMSILVENSRQSYQVSPQPTASPIELSTVTEEQINSEIQVLASRSLADQVVDPQWSDARASAMPADLLRAHDRAVTDFKKHLSVDMVRKSNVIHAVYTASDPRTANEVLTRLMNAFLTKQKEIGRPPGTSQFFASEATRYKKDLDNAEQELAAYQQDHQIVTLSDTEQALDRQINDAQTQLRSADVQIGEMSKRLSTQIRQAAKIPNRQSTQIRSIPNDYSVERLNTLLADLQNQRTALLTKFTPESRMVQQIDAQIANTKANLQHAEQMRSEERSTDVNPVWQQVTGSIVQNEAEWQALKAQRAQIANQIAKLRGNLSGVEGSTVTYNTLRQKVSELQTNYQTYAQKRDEAMIADAMDESRLVNVGIAQAPTFAITPASPRLTLDLVLGTFTAIFLASFAVFFAEMGRSVISTPREFDAVASYPLLATVPLERETTDPLQPITARAHLPITLNRDIARKIAEGGAEVERRREREVQAS